jgi:ribonuclease HII
VVACSLCFNLGNPPNENFLKTINDSKKIPEKKREEIFHEIIRLSNLKNPQIYF